MTKRTMFSLAGLGLLAFIFLFSGSLIFRSEASSPNKALAGTTQTVSISSSGEIGNDESNNPSISADGRFIAFGSEATNLVPGDLNGFEDVFVHDRVTGETEIISVSSSGEIGDWHSNNPSISADGQFVAFFSRAKNLVSGDTNGGNIFVHDRLSKKTEIVSVSSAGEIGSNESNSPSISSDGRFVAFSSASPNLVVGKTIGGFNVYVRDRSTGETEIVSVSSSGEIGAQSQSPSISGDGRFITFSSLAANLASGDTNGVEDIFVHDRLTGETEIVSASPSGEFGNKFSLSPSISADGQFIVFESIATNLIPGGTNTQRNIFVHDRLTGKNEIVSVSSSGEFGDNQSAGQSISADGQFVAFASAAFNLVSAEEITYLNNLYIHNRITKETEIISFPFESGVFNALSGAPIISADGQFIAFASDITGFASADTNDEEDILVHQRDISSEPVTPTPAPTIDPSTLTNRNYLPVIVK